MTVSLVKEGEREKWGKRKTEESLLSRPLTCCHHPQSLPQPASMSPGPSRLPPPPGGRIMARGCPPEHLLPGESLGPGPERETEISVINSGRFSREKNFGDSRNLWRKLLPIKVIRALRDRDNPSRNDTSFNPMLILKHLTSKIGTTSLQGTKSLVPCSEVPRTIRKVKGQLGEREKKH